MSIETINIPDIGTCDAVTIIELFVAEGDSIAQEASILTLESEKATMEVPSPMSGKIQTLKVKVGDKVKEGDEILLMEVGEEKQSTPAVESSVESTNSTEPAVNENTHSPTPQVDTINSATCEVNLGTTTEEVHAGPAVRRMAREFGVDLTQVTGHGQKGRVMKSDVKTYINEALQHQPTSGSSSISPLPKVDFTAFGEVEVQPLSRIKQLSGSNLHRNWSNIPHVTQFDEADITALEAFRQSLKTTAEKRGYKLTPLVFIMKAIVSALQQFPVFNASLSVDKNELILKKYFHLGVAVDTPNGLVVPVVRNVDQKGIYELAEELSLISKKARESRLTPKEMQGNTFTISSLGGISGTAFTPLINYPDVAILGVSRSSMQPKYDSATGNFEPRLMLPLSLSYDHRVIDGAEAARFTQFLTHVLEDIRRLLL